MRRPVGGGRRGAVALGAVPRVAPGEGRQAGVRAVVAGGAAAGRHGADAGVVLRGVLVRAGAVPAGVRGLLLRRPLHQVGEGDPLHNLFLILRVTT